VNTGQCQKLENFVDYLLIILKTLYYDEKEKWIKREILESKKQVLQKKRINL